MVRSMVVPGKQRHPAIDILLFFVTIGVYWFVWMWKAFGEVERFKGADIKRTAYLVPMILIYAVVFVLGMILTAEALAVVWEQFRTALETGQAPPEQAS